MAKKGKTGFLGMFAFGAMLFNAVAWILSCCNLNGKVTSVLQGIASILLIIVALVVAYDFANKQKKVWRIIYWVLAILTICAVLFGVGYNFV